MARSPPRSASMPLERVAALEEGLELDRGVPGRVAVHAHRPRGLGADEDVEALAARVLLHVALERLQRGVQRRPRSAGRRRSRSSRSRRRTAARPTSELLPRDEVADDDDAPNVDEHADASGTGRRWWPARPPRWCAAPAVERADPRLLAGRPVLPDPEQQEREERHDEAPHPRERRSSRRARWRRGRAAGPDGPGGSGSSCVDLLGRVTAGHATSSHSSSSSAQAGV